MCNYAGAGGQQFVKWCGLLMNVHTLELQADYTRYAGASLAASLTIPRTKVGRAVARPARAERPPLSTPCLMPCSFPCSHVFLSRAALVVHGLGQGWDTRHNPDCRGATGVCMGADSLHGCPTLRSRAGR